MRHPLLFLYIMAVCGLGALPARSQNPVYAHEKLVAINGYTMDAMEPQLHTNDQALFFNSLNDGNTTSLYYAVRTNDTVFTIAGAVPVVNQSITPRLDAVASIDTMANFYWISTRGYPANFDNLHRVRFLQTGYTNFGRVHGDFYIYQPGYLIMDAAISYYGDQLIYCNAYFNNCGNIPCQASMGIAQKVNDSTFTKLPNTTSLMASINDTANYCVYAPNLSADGLELYYTRFLKGGSNTEIMVATRSSIHAAFGPPGIVVSDPGLIPEAPSLSFDKSKMYYHKKVGGVYRIVVRYRMGATGLTEVRAAETLSLFPNPAHDLITVKGLSEPTAVEIRDLLGQPLVKTVTEGTLSVSGLPAGMYFISVAGAAQTFKILKH